MRVLDPNNTEFVIKVIPRFDITGDIILKIKDSRYEEYDISVLSSLLESEIESTLGEETSFFYAYISGYLQVGFGYGSFKEGRTYDFEIINNNKLAYKGHIFATSQNIEDYKLTKNKYIYAKV